MVGKFDELNFTKKDSTLFEGLYALRGTKLVMEVVNTG